MWHRPQPKPYSKLRVSLCLEQKQKCSTFCSSLVILHAFTSPGFVWRCPKDLWDNFSTAGFTRHRDICHQEPNRHSLSEQVSDVYLVQKHLQLFFHFYTFRCAENTFKDTPVRTVLPRSPSHKPADLSNVVLGSEKDGEFIKLPSYSALKSQLGGHNRITTQVCLCHHHLYVYISFLLPFNKVFLLLRCLHSGAIPIHLMTTFQESFAALCSVMEKLK